jgi:hypothetical protein
MVVFFGDLYKPQKYGIFLFPIPQLKRDANDCNDCLKVQVKNFVQFERLGVMSLLAFLSPAKKVDIFISQKFFDLGHELISERLHDLR